MGDDKRGSFRKRILKGAFFSYRNESCTSECVIRNISETGALIEVGDTLLLPDKFKLHNELDRYKVDCEVVRRVGNAAGIRFVGKRIPIKPSRVQVVTLPARKNHRDTRTLNSFDKEEATPAQSIHTEDKIPTYPKKKIVFGRC